jgi:hypothetical protein
MRELLRHVIFGPVGCEYELKLYDTGECFGKYGAFAKSRLAYEFGKVGQFALFKGDDFGCSPQYAINSDQALRSLIGFLTLRQGDTDAEYFEEYTPAQLNFIGTDAEELSMWSDEELGDVPFRDVEVG